MTTIADEVERLVPTSTDRPLLRGLLIGFAVGATLAGLVVLGQSLQARRAARQSPPRQGPPPAPPYGAEPSPL